MLNKAQYKEIYGLDLDQIVRCVISHSKNSKNSENPENELTIYTIFGDPIIFSEESLGLESFYELYTYLFYTYLFKKIPLKYCPCCKGFKMNKDIKISKNELKKISSEFRMYADRLIQTNEAAGIQDLIRFVNFIDQSLVISSFLKDKRRESNFQFISFNHSDLPELHSKYPKDEITLIHHFLQYGVEKFSTDYTYDYRSLIGKSGCDFGYTLQDDIKEFNFRIIKPFISYIEVYLESLEYDLGDNENAKLIFNFQGDNLANYLGTTMNEMNFDQRNSSIGVGINQGKIHTEKLAGTINEAEKQNLAEAAAKIRQLLEQLSQTYPTHTTAQKMVVAAEAIERIESDPIWKQRVINAAKEGGLAAFEKAIDNPIGAFVVGAVKGWQETEV